MTLRACGHQTEVQQLLEQGHWPHACPAELRAHLSGCRTCAELVLVTQAFQQSRASAAAQVKLPAPGAIWWRAQLRRRNAAVERVGKPILGAYVFALSVAVLVAAVFAFSQARNGLRWLEASESFNPSAWVSAGGSLIVLIPVFAMVALVGAVVVYIAAERH
ncbi:MAG: hypothetical protein ABR987_23685 [Terracidiphilus sp.]|jgi:hypothetical protein